MPDLHITVPEPTSDEIDLMKARLLAFIFPNTPKTPNEEKAFDKAIRLQIAHDKTVISETGNNQLPQGTSSFTIGTFSMSFDKGATDGKLTRKTICPSVYGILLRAGLLYRGVEGRC